MTILSAGENSVIPEPHGKHVVGINVRDFWDPEAGRYTGHVGGHPRILEGLRNTNTTLLLRVLKQALDTIEAHSNNCDCIQVQTQSAQECSLRYPTSALVSADRYRL